MDNSSIQQLFEYVVAGIFDFFRSSRKSDPIAEGKGEESGHICSPENHKSQKDFQFHVEAEASDHKEVLSWERLKQSPLTQDEGISEICARRDAPTGSGAVHNSRLGNNQLEVQLREQSAPTGAAAVGLTEPAASLGGGPSPPGFSEELRTSLTSDLQSILSLEQRSDSIHYINRGSGRSSPVRPLTTEFIFNILIAAPYPVDGVPPLARRLLLDLLCEDNFMSDELQSDLGLPLQEHKTPESEKEHTIKGFLASHQAAPLGQVKAKWLIVDNSLTGPRPLTREFTTWFIVIKTAGFDVLLGRRSFSEHQLYRRFTSLLEPWKKSGYQFSSDLSGQI